MRDYTFMGAIEVVECLRKMEDGASLYSIPVAALRLGGDCQCGVKSCRSHAVDPRTLSCFFSLGCATGYCHNWCLSSIFRIYRFALTPASLVIEAHYYVPRLEFL